MGDGGRANPWRTHRSRQVYDNPWITVREEDATSPGGRPALYGVVSFKKLAIGAVPLTADGRVHLVGQWRYTLDAFSWEIPEGGGEPGADPLDEARRELLEETGLEAADWREILRLHTSNSVTDEAAVIYLATGLNRASAPRPEDTESDMEQACIPFMEALDWIADGRITDAMSAAGLFRVHHMALQGALDPALAEAVLGGPG